MRDVLRKGVAAWMFNSHQFRRDQLSVPPGLCTWPRRGSIPLYTWRRDDRCRLPRRLLYRDDRPAPGRCASPGAGSGCGSAPAWDVLWTSSPYRVQSVLVAPLNCPPVPLPSTSAACRLPMTSRAHTRPGPSRLPLTCVPLQASRVRDISFTLPPGRLLGLLGRTGSGKTTLTRLLFRLYDPAAGSIYLSGVDIRDLALTGLRRGVGMITQDVQLFRASIRDNLAFFDRAHRR